MQPTPLVLSSPHDGSPLAAALEKGVSITQLGRLGPNSCLGDLPMCDFGIEASTSSAEVAEEFRRWPDRAGVVISLPSASYIDPSPSPLSYPESHAASGKTFDLISQHTFYKILSRPFGREIFSQRPIQVMLEMVEFPTLRLPSTTPIAEGANM